MALDVKMLLSASRRVDDAKRQYKSQVEHIMMQSAQYKFVNELAVRIDAEGLRIHYLAPDDIYADFSECSEVMRCIAHLEEGGFEFNYEGLELNENGQIAVRVIHPNYKMIDVRFCLADDATCRIIEHKTTEMREVEVTKRIFVC